MAEFREKTNIASTSSSPSDCNVAFENLDNPIYFISTASSAVKNDVDVVVDDVGVCSGFYVDDAVVWSSSTDEPISTSTTTSSSGSSSHRRHRNDTDS